MKKITIIGAGVFGFALAKIIGDKHSNKDICIYDIAEEQIKHIAKTKQHPVFKTIARLSPHIRATHYVEEAVKGSQLVILAVPSAFMRDALRNLKGFLQDGMILLNISKGLENKTNFTMSEVIKDELKNIDVKLSVCTLSGGMIAKEVVLKNPLCAEVACENITIAKKIVKMLENEHFRLEASDDVMGVELSGAFKNVIAIGAGIFDGLGYSASSKSAFVSYAASQISKLALSLGAKEKTFDAGGQAWFGDLMTTCFGQSRNREFGEIIGKTGDVEKALEKMRNEGKTVEGYITTKVVFDLVKKKKINAPLIKLIYSVLYNKMEPKNFINNFIKKW